MKVTVVIPVYNEEKVIGECLASLAKQTYPDFEVIVVDDGSVDKTVDVLSKLKIKNFKLKILRAAHHGPGAARNLGAKSAKGEILVFVDADMTFAKNFLKKLVKPIIKGQSKGTFSKEEHVKNWENVWARCWNLNEGIVGKRRVPAGFPNEHQVFRALLKSEFDRVGGFEPGGYTDDYSLSRKLGYLAKKTPGAIYFHNNPDNLKEVFNQAKWVAKRKYKFGFFGYLVALLRSSLPVSKAIGLYKAVKYKMPRFIIFKTVYDFGIFWGIIEYLLFKKGAK